MSINFFRLICFVLLLLFFLVLESLFPKRKLQESKKNRWILNLSLISIGTLFLSLVRPFSAFFVAFKMSEQNSGLLNIFVNYYKLNHFIAYLLGFLILDLGIYLQHVLFHKIDFLWRIHRVHHIDKDLDVSTGLRFHPLEIFISLAIKIAIIFVFGIDPFVVVLFEIVLNGTSLFNHSNFNIPMKYDRFLRFFVVTPDMHRIHHSIYEKETMSNFGFNFPWWDYLFKTYIPYPKDGSIQMKLGLKYFRSKKYNRILPLLALPFKKL